MRNKAVFPIPRAGLVVLLITVVLAIAPHLFRLPFWVPGIAAVCILWRIQVFRERLRFPSRTIRFAMVLSSLAAVFAFYGTVVGPDAGVTLLILAYLFKLLEMYKERDAFLVVILSYFVVATNYLFSTSLLSSVFTFVVVLCVTASLVALNQTQTEIKFRKLSGIALKMAFLALPIMIVLFVFVPRITPMWALNIHNDSAKTGLSDSVSPGDISNLSKSTALAFTVSFTETDPSKKPKQKDLYWRGVSYVDFDGRTWRRDEQDSYKAGALFNKEEVLFYKDAIKYRVIMEPTYRHWLFTLPFSVVDVDNVNLTPSLVQARKDPVSSLLAYNVKTHVNYTYQQESLNPSVRERNIALPDTDVRAKRKAKQMFEKVNGNYQQYMRSVLAWFNTDNFVYTLKPPALKFNTVDGFLFSTQQGFCAHYAGAFVFLMRSVGIPARMIGGYQGGEYHDAGHLVVRQYHAHAWAEVWFEGRGWVRVDPTAAVAPERVLVGPEDATTDSSFSTDSPLSPLLLRNHALLKSLRSNFEYVNFLWSKWVVGYDSSTQSEFLSEWMEGVTPQKLVNTMLLLLGLIMAVLSVALLIQRGRIKLDPVDALYLRFCEKSEDKGLARQSGEGVWAFCERASMHFPQNRQEIERITQLYDDLRYGVSVTENTKNNHGVNDTIVGLKNEFKREIRQLRLE